MRGYLHAKYRNAIIIFVVTERRGGGVWTWHRLLGIIYVYHLVAGELIRFLHLHYYHSGLVLRSTSEEYLLTSQISRKSCCSTRSSSQVVFVTTVLSLGRSCRIDSPNVAPTPKLHSVTGSCLVGEVREERLRFVLREPPSFVWGLILG